MGVRLTAVCAAARFLSASADLVSRREAPKDAADFMDHTQSPTAITTRSRRMYWFESALLIVFNGKFPDRKKSAPPQLERHAFNMRDYRLLTE